jgi:hypothetical protein
MIMGTLVDILVAQNPHFHDNWQIQHALACIPAHAIGFNYGLG